ncbi:hypothetical protein ADL22_27180 [Streptomyces sp. NRRL F-4489]|nr:hypothetical protein ADL22_27180 [Streptomyces sp. NRRL F-4489]
MSGSAGCHCPRGDGPFDDVAELSGGDCRGAVGQRVRPEPRRDVNRQEQTAAREGGGGVRCVIMWAEQFETLFEACGRLSRAARR